MIDHLTLQVGDTAASRHFYAAMLAPLGLHPACTDGDGIGFATSDGSAPFWLVPALGASSREVHVAFTAASRSTVDDFHTAARRIDAEVLHPPRIFPEYHPAYDASFVRDPDGNTIEAVCHRAPRPTRPERGDTRRLDRSADVRRGAGVGKDGRGASRSEQR